ncbi:MAG TPA: Ig-like domain-containing protein [Anaerolineales bacterium]
MIMRSGLLWLAPLGLVFIVGISPAPSWVQARNHTESLDSSPAATQVNEIAVPPVAGNDSYWMLQGEILNVAAPGVLENDHDFDGDNLSAELEDTPENGVLGLNLDGSFTYTPDTSFVGQDVFRYRASDSGLESNLAEVIITVSEVDNQSPAVEWLSPAVDEGVLSVFSDEIILLEAGATDNSGIAAVRFYRWDAVDLVNVEIGIVYESPFRWELEAQDLNWGPNQINVKAYDLSGNESERKHIWIYKLRRVFLPVLGK